MNEMAWEVGDTGFEMKLSAYVPNIIQSGIKNLLGTLNNGKPMEFDFYAIHPGGKKILQVVEEQLAMSRENNRHSRSVLKNYGNMSSATILFVFHEIYKHLNASDDQKKVLSFAFGPGLTMESLILTTHIAS